MGLLLRGTHIIMALLPGIVKVADRISNSNSTKFALNSVIKDYGKITEININRNAKKIEMSLDLKGEAETIHLEIVNYEIKDVQDGLEIMVKDILCSRKWLEALFRTFIADNLLKVPKKYSEIIIGLLV